MKKVSIVVPIYNEERSIDELLERISTTTDLLQNKYRFEVILIDDGSADGSIDAIKRNIRLYENVVAVELRRNFGQTAALQAGIDLADGDYIITMDGDLQHFPEELPQFIQEIEKGFDVVCGWRHQRQEGILRRWPSRAANFLIRRISGLRIHDIGTTFRIYRREIVNELQLLGEAHRFVPVHAAIIGARIGELPIKNVPRPAGKSSYGLGRTLNVLLDLTFLYFYTRYFDRPIRIFGKISLVLLGISALIAGVLIGDWLLTGRPIAGRSGWATLSMFLAAQSATVILIGLIGEVLVRTFYASTDTTFYRLRNVWTSERLNSRVANRLPGGMVTNIVSIPGTASATPSPPAPGPH